VEWKDCTSGTRVGIRLTPPRGQWRASAQLRRGPVQCRYWHMRHRLIGGAEGGLVAGGPRHVGLRDHPGGMSQGDCMSMSRSSAQSQSAAGQDPGRRSC
jgi:hypothetical protein